MSVFLGLYYDNFLMGNFTDALKKHQSLSDEKGHENILRGFITGETEGSLKEKNYYSFRYTIENLIKVGCYSPIIKFMYGVFGHGNIYNLTELKKALDIIKVSTNDKLSDLCADFYILMQKKMDPYFENEVKDVYMVNPYFGKTKDYLGRSYSPYEITMELPYFIIKRILEIDIDIRKLTRNDVDYIVTEMIKIKANKLISERDNINKINEKQDEIERQNANFTLKRIVPQKVTAFEEKMEVLGILFDLFSAAELSNQKEICYYIQTEYLWPIMKIVPWKQKSSFEVQLMGILFGSYTDMVVSLMLSQKNIYNLSKTNSYYNEEAFYEELISNNCGVLLEPGTTLTKEYSNLGLLMSEAVFSGKEVIKHNINETSYSFLMAITPYLLYCSGHLKEAILFLIKYYNEISLHDRRNLYVELTLVKCILASTKLEEANVLYGYYNYEMGTQEREKKSKLLFDGEIVEYIKDVKKYLKLNRQYTFDTKKTWFNVVFGDGRIMGDVDLAESIIKKGEIIPETLFSKLMLYVDAFSHFSGIRLSVLRLPNEDNYDKLPNALTVQLINQGQGLLSKMDEYIEYYHSSNQLDIRQNINVFLQRHLSKLMDDTIQESMNKIMNLRTVFLKSNKDINFDGSNLSKYKEIIMESKVEEMLKFFEEITDELSIKLGSQQNGRAEVEYRIYQLQRNFIEKYNLDIPQEDLISLLPLLVQNDCTNYLVTSEIVYRVLSNRTDVDRLDFSPALIPLTKSLELVLNLVFKRMTFVALDMDSESRSFYFIKPKKGKFKNKKRSIEFGPCINLLKDSYKINVNYSGGNYLLSWNTEAYFIPDRSRFSKLNGSTVIVFDRLKEFAGLNILIEPSKYQPSVAIPFTLNEEHNRMLFIKGLEYVKDNYRNIVAHKDTISLQTLEECRKILLQTQNLLWILLYILKL